MHFARLNDPRSRFFPATTGLTALDRILLTVMRMKTTTALKIAIVSLGSLGALTLASCKEKGPMEKAGESIDEAVEEVGDEIDDATN